MAEEKIDLNELSDSEKADLYAKQVQDMNKRAPRGESE